MAVTAIADIINPEVLTDQVSAKFPDMLVLGNSNLVAVDSTVPLGFPGTLVKMPFWNRMTGFASLAEGTAMTPNKITTNAEFAVVQRAGGSWEVYDTAQLVSKANPVDEISTQIARRAAEYMDAALVVELNKTPNVYNYSQISTGLYDQNVLVTGLVGTLGDNFMAMLSGGALIMHSKPYGDLLKTGAIQNQYQSGMDVIRTGVIPTLMGLPIIVSDLVTTATVSTVLNYNSYILAPQTLELLYQRAVQVEYDRDILLQADVIAATVHFAAHLRGYDDNSSTVVAEQNKSIHAVKIVTK